MAEKAESGNVRAGVYPACGYHQIRSLFVERCHALCRPVDHVRSRGPGLDGGAHNARAQRFGQNHPIAGLCAPVKQNFCRMNQTGDGKTVLELFVFHAVAADQKHSRLPHLIQAAPQHVP